jgi:DNA-binding beta-propeller fold protein YncE
MKKRFIWRSLGIVASLLVLATVAAAVFIRWRHFVAAPPEAPQATDAPAFQGRIAALSDLDQAASGYADGKLSLLPGQSDQLSIIDGDTVASVGVSNSVIGWPTTQRASKGGRFVYVAEIRGQASAGTQRIAQPFKNFPPGSDVTVIDTSGSTPRVVARIDGGKNPGTLDVNAAGDVLAVGTDVPGARIRLWRLENGVPAGLPIDVDVDVPPSNRPGVRALRFHPSGNFLAVNSSDLAIGFFAVTRNAEGRVTGLKPHGNLVHSSGGLSVLTEVEFTPDGRHLLVPDVQWGEQKAWQALTTPPGRLLSIRFDATSAAQHAIVGSVTVGRSPEGMEVSPDGRFAITVNMERTFLPDLPGLSRLFGGNSAGSLSLVAIDPNTGALSAQPPVRLDAILPEDVIFDATGRGVAVAIYERPGDGKRERGFVDFWRVAGDGLAARLERTSHSIQLPRGVHDLELLAPVGR